MDMGTQAVLLEQFKTLLSEEVKTLKKDVFRYLRQSRLQSFERVCPFLNTPIPYKTMVDASVGRQYVSPISFTTQEHLIAKEALGDEISLQSMINGQILPFSIKSIEQHDDEVRLEFSNDSGFFNWPSNYLDLWCYGRNMIFSNVLFERLKDAQFELCLQTRKGIVHKKIHIENVPFAHLHPNERLRDELRDPRYYQCVRLRFENDLTEVELQKAWLVISGLSVENLDINRIGEHLMINIIPLINSRTGFAQPIHLKGEREGYPLISELGEHLSLLKLKSVNVVHKDGRSEYVPTREMSQSDELCYDLVRPDVENAQRYSHIYPYQVSYGEHIALNIEASWYDRRNSLGKLSEVKFLSKPVESCLLATRCFIESLPLVEMTMDAMRRIQNLSYLKQLTGEEVSWMIDFLAIEDQLKERLQALRQFCQKFQHDASFHKDQSDRHISSHPLLNHHLNSVLKLLIQYQVNLVK